MATTSLAAPVDAALAARALGRVQKLLELVDRDAPPTRCSRWRRTSSGDFIRAADELHEIGSLPDEAYACLRAAEGLLAAGEREQGQEQLGRGLEFWRSVGAAAYVREGEALLPEVGRPS